MKNIIEKLTEKNYTTKEQTASDVKKNRFFVTLANDDKVINIAQVVYSNKKTAYQLKANRQFAKAVLHAGWAMPYARKFDNAEDAIKCIAELKVIYEEEIAEKKAKAEQKKQKKEAEQTETAEEQKTEEQKTEEQTAETTAEETEQKTEDKKEEQTEQKTEQKTEKKRRRRTKKTELTELADKAVNATK